MYTASRRSRCGVGRPVSGGASTAMTASIPGAMASRADRRSGIPLQITWRAASPKAFISRTERASLPPSENVEWAWRMRTGSGKLEPLLDAGEQRVDRRDAFRLVQRRRVADIGKGDGG